MLLQCAQAKLTKNDLALFTGCALFVCNKWDLIQPNEQEEVKEAQVKKLFKKLPNLDRRKQMVYLSCTTAQTCQKYGYITQDFNNLIAGISHLIVSAMQNKLEMHFRYLNKVYEEKRSNLLQSWGITDLIYMHAFLTSQFRKKVGSESKQIKRAYRHRCVDCVYENQIR